jgi:FixJ family two-component response regulator
LEARLAACCVLPDRTMCSNESAEAFLEGLPSHKVDCALMDIRLSGLSGLYLQDVLRRIGPLLPVIFVGSLFDGLTRALA